MRGLEARPAWIWVPDALPALRYGGVLFRCELQLGEAPPRQADLWISGSTSYRLHVNGLFVGAGPCRSGAGRREVDTFDLLPVLRPGRNTLAVEVRHVAFATYQRPFEAPGFVAWGNVQDGDGRTVPLATPGAWRCRVLAGLAADAPPLSFAQGPVEIHDLRADAASGPEAWVGPEVVAGPQPVTALRARTIPPLTRLLRSAVSLRLYPDVACERLVSTRIAASIAGRAAEDRGIREWGAVRAWIWSPRDQTVECGAWWSSYWVGDCLQAKTDAPELPLRQRVTLNLRAGWQRMRAIGEVVFGYWDFCLACPVAAGLVVRRSPRMDDRCVLERAGPFPGPMRSDAVPGGWDGVADGWSPVEDGDDRTRSVLRTLAWFPSVASIPAGRFPVWMEPDETFRLVADFGEVTLAKIVCEIDAPAGTVVDLGHAEEADATGRPQYGKVFTVHAADRFVLAGGRQRIETFDPRGFRHLELRVSGHRSPVTLHALEAVETRYPYRFGGEFECSDADFNRLWVYARRTLELCSEDVLTDCPWRERTLYAGDLLAEMGATVAQTRDVRLVRRSLDVLLQSADPETGWMPGRAPGEGDGDLADYPLLALIAAAWVLRLADDPSFARRAWTVGRTLAHTLEGFRNAEGLYDPPMRAFIDHGRRVTEGPTVAFNAACVAAWRALAEIAQAAGEAGSVPALKDRADRLERLLAEAYFDPAAGMFRDLPLRAGGRETEGSPAIVWPLLFAPGTRRLAEDGLPALRRMLAAFDPARESESVSPYQMFYLLSLLRALGESELAELAIRRVYGAMLATPTGTLWENALPDKSLAHAWSAGVADYCATGILGVRMGFEDARELATVQVRPLASSLTWAKGCVPHPLGDVHVEWERSGGLLRVRVGAPEGVVVEVVPAGPLAQLVREVRILRAPRGGAERHQQRRGMRSVTECVTVARTLSKRL